MNLKEKPQTIYLQDYQTPAYWVKTVNLEFDLDTEQTRVRSRLKLQKNPDSLQTELILDGEGLFLEKIALNGRDLAANEYIATSTHLRISKLPDQCEIEIHNRISPANNTALEGLYVSSGNFCTQCEAQGFRKITYYPDRPDVMSRFTTTITADVKRYPVLLSNGNLIAQGETDNQRHWVRWEDPYAKPCYLFAMVAGDLHCIEDHYTTSNERKILLQIYVQSHNRDKCDHAMRSLKNAMRWDEETFGLEYDLGRYMIVAVDDFNMGAMENKGLNIFNSKYVLAKPETATDLDYINIEAVIGHEYFHNWTGNRVTCRDWFQLSLKEGLTVFRDQEFSSDRNVRAVKRINAVRLLRTMQFAEDASPMAHPIRPDSYIEINNFYTLTVYEKGAEVIRMQHTLLGKAGFRKGMDLYFQRHDGQAVTTDDFVKAMEDANKIDLTQFRLWYSQAGTPTLKIEDHYDNEKQIYILTVRQSCPATPGQTEKQAMHIPLAMGLLSSDGHDLHLLLDSGEQSIDGTIILNITRPVQKFTFINIKEKPVPSLLRGFSAPVRLFYSYSKNDLLFLQLNDSDDFNRWDAGQELALKIIRELLECVSQGKPLHLDNDYADAMADLLQNRKINPSLLAESLTLPSEKYIAEQMDVVDIDGIHLVREFLLSALAKRLKSSLAETVNEFMDTGEYKIDALSMGRRKLKNICLAYLTQLGTTDGIEMVLSQYRDANNMTDIFAALSMIADIDGQMREDILQDFYQKWQHDSLVMDKWLSVQAMSKVANTVTNIRRLMKHPVFSIKNPNKVYALLGTFSKGNSFYFHQKDGLGYQILSEAVVELDSINPQVASRMAAGFSQWERFDVKRQVLMKKAMQNILDKKELSADVYEIISKSLQCKKENEHVKALVL